LTFRLNDDPKRCTTVRLPVCKRPTAKVRFDLVEHEGGQLAAADFHVGQRVFADRRGDGASPFVWGSLARVVDTASSGP